MEKRKKEIQKLKDEVIEFVKRKENLNDKILQNIKQINELESTMQL